MKNRRNINTIINGKANLKNFNWRKILGLDIKTSTVAIVSLLLFCVMSFYIGISVMDNNVANASEAVTVAFEVNGGTSVNTPQSFVNTTYETLPSTTKDGALFAGWYTSNIGGEKVTTTTTPVTGTLYARWVEVDAISAQTYTGLGIEPSITFGGTTLTKGNDYTVTYENNQNVGTATATIAGINNYTGSVVKNFNITQKEITMDWEEIAASDITKTYDGDTTVKFSGETSKVVTINGVTVGGTTEAVKVAVTGEYATNENAGSDKTANLSAALTEDAVNSNYTLTSTTASYNNTTISQKDLTIVAAAEDKTYDGTNVATVNFTEFSGKISGDDVTIGQTSRAGTFNKVNVLADPNAKINVTLSEDFTIIGADAGNYRLIQPSSLSAKITAASLLMVWDEIDTCSRTKVYDKSTDFKFGTNTSKEVNLTGVTVSGIPQTVVATVTGAYTSANAAETVRVDFSASIEDGNYTLTNDTKIYQDGKITKAEITYTTEVMSKTYNGSQNITVKLTYLSGRAGNDTETEVNVPTSVTGTVTDSNVGNNKDVTVAAITLTGTNASNYKVSLPSGLKANITKDQSKTITFEDITAFTYDGSAIESVETATSDCGIAPSYSYYTKNEQGAKTAIEKTAIIDAGTYYVEASITSGNYEVTPVEKTITVKPRQLKVKGITVDSKTYDTTRIAPANLGNASLVGATVEGDGIVGGDNVTIVSTGVVWKYEDANVGTGKTASRAEGAYALGGTDAANYEIVNTSATLTGDITAKVIDVAVTCNGKGYDGSTTATVTVAPATASDVYEADRPLGFTYTSAVFDNAEKGSNKLVTVSGISSNNNNYAVSSGTKTSTCRASITNAAGTITFGDITAFTYDGSAIESVENATTSPGGVTISYRYYESDNETIISKENIIDAGTYYVEAYVDDDNYTFTPVRKTITVNPIDLKLTGITIDSKTYDKKTDATANMTSAVLGALAGNGILTADEGADKVALDTTGVTWNFENANAGTRAASRTGNYSLKGTRKNNYRLQATNTQSSINGTINPKEIEVTVSCNGKAYDGTNTATVTIAAANASDIILGDTVNFSSTTATFEDANVGSGKTVTVEGISSSNDNYKVGTTTKTCTANITKNTGLSAPTASLSLDAVGETVYSGTTVTLATTSGGASVYYGLGNSEINTQYSSSIAITADTTIKAVTRRTGYEDSSTSTFTYKVRTINHVLDAISGAGSVEALSTILTTEKEKALLNTDTELATLLTTFNTLGSGDKNGILTKILAETNKTGNTKTFKTMLEEEIHVFNMEKVLSNITAGATLAVSGDATYIENLAKVENAVAEYEKLTSSERGKLSQTAQAKYASISSDYQTLSNDNSTSKFADTNVEIQAIGLLTKVTKSEGTSKVVLQVEPKEITSLSSTVATITPVLAYDIDIKEVKSNSQVVDATLSGSIVLKIEIPMSLKNKKPEIHHLASLSSAVTEGTKVGGQRLTTVDDKLYIVFETSSFSPFVVTTSTANTLSVTCGSNGTASVTGTQEITDGQQVEITITPNDGYIINQVTLNGVSQTVSDNKITITGDGTGSDLAVNITFKAKSSSSGGGGGSSSGGSSSSTTTTTSASLTVVNSNTTSNHVAYMSGYETGAFGPTDPMTREQVATIFSKVDAGFSAVTNYANKQTNPRFNFSDVAASKWSANYIGYASKINAMTGYEDGTFKPEKNITRAEFAAALVKYKGMAFEGKTSKFKDVQGQWFEGYVAALEEAGYVSGYDDGTYGSNNNITRAEVCIMMNNILGRTPNDTKVKALANINKFSDVSTSSWYYTHVMEATNTHNAASYH